MSPLPDLVALAKRYHLELALHLHHPRRNGTACQHAAWMCQQIAGMVAEGERSKADRWIGFIQAILWTSKLFTLDDLREQTKKAIP